MVGAHVVGVLSGAGEVGGFSSTAERLSFIFFPLSTMVGLALAVGLSGVIDLNLGYKYEKTLINAIDEEAEIKKKKAAIENSGVAVTVQNAIKMVF